MQEKIKLNDHPKDERGYYEIVNGEKIYQIEEKTENDKLFNENCNAWRASGLSPMQYLHSKK